MKNSTKKLLSISAITALAGTAVIVFLLMLRGIIPTPMSIQLLGIEIRMYSLAVITGILITVLLFENLRKQDKDLRELDVWEGALVAVIPGVIGARIYHVLTDFHLYQDNLSAVLNFANGGLGIIGGLIAGGAALILYLGWKKLPRTKVLGLLVIVVPVAQAVGRLGNFFNRELFGLPTALPWGMYIAPENNPFPILTGFSYFQPLFLYEALWNLGLAVVLFWLWKKGVHGSTLLIGYISGYGFMRYILDFMRIDGNSGLYFQDINLALSYTQLIILGWFLFAMVFGVAYQFWYKNKYGVWFTKKTK